MYKCVGWQWLKDRKSSLPPLGNTNEHSIDSVECKAFPKGNSVINF